MFSSIHIENFRGIKEATLTGFRQLNVFWGKNDCGKTTLLESLFLLSGPSNPRLPLSINVFRAYSSLNEDDLKLWFYQLNEMLPIVLKSTNEVKRELIITPIHSLPTDEESVIDQSNPKERIFGLKLSFRYNNREFKSELKVNQDVNKPFDFLRPDDYSETLVTRFLHTNTPLDGSITFLNSIIKDNKKDFILKPMHQFDHRIRDWNVVNGVVMVDIGLRSLVPINIMGNGLRKLINILAAIYSCKNGMLFIDEIDNGVHFLHFSGMWESISQAAKDYNVQIFATTHSLDCMKGFSDALDESSLGLGYVLEVDQDGHLEAQTYSTYQLKLAFANGYDIR